MVRRLWLPWQAAVAHEMLSPTGWLTIDGAIQSCLNGIGLESVGDEENHLFPHAHPNRALMISLVFFEKVLDAGIVRAAEKARFWGGKAGRDLRRFARGHSRSLDPLAGVEQVRTGLRLWLTVAGDGSQCLGKLERVAVLHLRSRARPPPDHLEPLSRLRDDVAFHRY